MLEYDHIIVGSGIVGLSVAANILERNKNAQVAVLERGLLPTGASTRNAGFACYGSLTEMLADLKVMTEDEMLAIVELRYKGLRKLHNRLNRYETGYEATGGYELFFEKHPAAFDEIDRLNRLLNPIFKENALEICNEKISDFGFNKQQVHHLISLPHEGQLN